MGKIVFQHLKSYFYILKLPLMKFLKPTGILLLTVLFFSSKLIAQKADETAIRQLLNRQSKDWNNGKIEEYMKGYRNSDSLIFIGKNGPRYGYATTMASYRKGYPDTAAMGKLNCELLQLKRLSPQYYFVTGKWHLTRTVGDLQGYFTLLLKKIKNKWLIIEDHSS